MTNKEKVTTSPALSKEAKIGITLSTIIIADIVTGIALAASDNSSKTKAASTVERVVHTDSQPGLRLNAQASIAASPTKPGRFSTLPTMRSSNRPSSNPATSSQAETLPFTQESPLPEINLLTIIGRIKHVLAGRNQPLELVLLPSGSIANDRRAQAITDEVIPPNALLVHEKGQACAGPLILQTVAPQPNATSPDDKSYLTYSFLEVAPEGLFGDIKNFGKNEFSGYAVHSLETDVAPADRNVRVTDDPTRIIDKAAQTLESICSSQQVISSKTFTGILGPPQPLAPVYKLPLTLAHVLPTPALTPAP